MHPQVSRLDGRYPRPQLVRDAWSSLDGTWLFAADDDGVGERDRWFDDTEAAAAVFDRRIVVPFPPESPASGIGESVFHRAVWYRRTVGEKELSRLPGADERALIHFGAIDHLARVWFDGELVAEHVGGQTPFQLDVTDQLSSRQGEHVLVVRAEDDPLDAAVPRGKQDWQALPHGIWYERTTGIWQTVWAEMVPAVRLVDVAWTPDVLSGSVECELTLSQRPAEPLVVHVTISLDGQTLAYQSVLVGGSTTTFSIVIPAMANGQDRARFLWAPEHPVLLDARIDLTDAARAVTLDSVGSYFGMRSVGVGRGHFQLNGRQYYLRAVLDQGYWKDTHLANPGTEWLREEVELVKAMGFNTVRVHQKAEDPRFLYWADRLGLLVWAETANAYEFSARAVELLVHEWLELVRRDRSHPSVAVWVPLNESWGVQSISVNARQQAYAQALASLTRAVDGSRPVVSNEGWEHVESDVLGLHDYTDDPAVLIARYGSAEAIQRTLDSPGPLGRVVMIGDAQRARFAEGRSPLMITEFGGISYASGGETWGYSTVTSEEEYADHLARLFDAMRACEGIVGFCYTQLTDTVQEANGLLTTSRKPKLAVETIRQIITGEDEPPKATSTMGWLG